MNTVVMVLTVLLGISEALAQIPVIKANSIFELALHLLQALVGALRNFYVKDENSESDE